MTRVQHREKRKTDILNSAFEVFSKNGYENSKVEDIAVHANIGKGTVYEYFPSKSQLFTSCLMMLFEEYHQEIERIFSSDDAIRCKFDEYITFSSTCFDVASFVLPVVKQRPDNMDFGDFFTVFEELYNKEIDLITKSLVSAIENKEIRHDIDLETTSVLIHSISSEVTMKSKFRNAPLQTDKLLSILFDGIKA